MERCGRFLGYLHIIVPEFETFELIYQQCTSLREFKISFQYDEWPDDVVVQHCTSLSRIFERYEKLTSLSIDAPPNFQWTCMDHFSPSNQLLKLSLTADGGYDSNVIGTLSMVNE